MRRLGRNPVRDLRQVGVNSYLSEHPFAVLLQYKGSPHSVLDPFVLGLHDDGHANNTDEGGTTGHQKRGYRKP